jgi:hypothetical protein
MKRIIFTIIAIWLAASTALKASRYFHSNVNDDLRIEDIISDILQKQGWKKLGLSASERPLIRQYQALNVIEFQKESCNRHLKITFLNFGDATSKALVSTLGANVTFIYDAKITNTLPTQKQGYHVLIKSAQNLLNLNYTHEVPVIALSDMSSTTGCDVSLVDYWHDIEREFNK